MKARVIAVVAATVLCACAVIEKPSGGPEDKTPPGVVDIIPSEDSTGVANDATVTIEFSEKIDGESFKSKVTTYPPLEFKDVRARGKTLELKFREDLPDTTICVLLKAGFKDHHMVESRTNYKFFFSTEDRIDSGSISGKILFKQNPDSAGVAMLVKAADADSVDEVYSADESRITFSDGFGNYTFRRLPADSTRFLLWAFIDKDNDGRFSFGKEFYLAYPDTLLLTGENTSLRGIDFNIIDPDEPGTVEGVVVDRTGLGMPPFLRLDKIDDEGTFFAVSADTLGNYNFRVVTPGKFLLTAFIDMNADSLAGDYTSPADSISILREPFIVFPDTIDVAPGEEKKLGIFELAGEE